MTVPFDPTAALVIVDAEITGPAGIRVARLALDTGATVSTLNQDTLDFLGYDTATASDRLRIVSATGAQVVGLVRVERIRSLGHESRDQIVVCHNIPAAAGIDGLLGLDFLRGRRLTVDFNSGQIELA